MNERSSCLIERASCGLESDWYEAPGITGERTVPGFSEENYWFQRHLVVYEFIKNFTCGKRVVDLGCGEGYGVDVLASVAESAVGVDLSRESLYNARLKYPKHNTEFVLDDLYNVSDCPDGEFDVVCCLQVVEHLHDPESLAREMKRLMAANGIAFISTPNILTNSPNRRFPINPFHLFEFDSSSFSEFMAENFEFHEILCLHHGRRLKFHEKFLMLDTIGMRFKIPSIIRNVLHQGILLPSVKSSDFSIGHGDRKTALDFIGMGWKSSLH